ncbi:MAG TPA: TIGR03088 family PEP-CTERM/XrtA system glycosyltransferase [Burkholderiaceae bacterium]|nr:TIGR03088 family PEP-CTERM/XrtA system glycosyltransferase [Burkholderiaceae bacterium]
MSGATTLLANDPSVHRSPAHLVHVIHRLDTGGMENGLVNLVNHLPADRYRHTIVSLTGTGPIAERIVAPTARIVSLDRRPGPLARDLPRIWRLLRELAPDLVHTRNVGTLEAQVAAWAAGVPARVHGEHGWEVHDLAGSNRSLLRTRRLLRGFVHRQVALSEATRDYLRSRVGVRSERIVPIMNGVDTQRFHPRSHDANAEGEADRAAPGSADVHRLAAHGAPPWPADAPVIGYVGRLADVKHPLLLLQALELLAFDPALAASGAKRAPRVALVGSGPQLTEIRTWLSDHKLADRVWLAGDRADVPELLRCFDVHALPSLAEGISNTLLEAMASGLPSVATRVGGNHELIDDGHTGLLVPSNDAVALATALRRYLLQPALRREHGALARQRAVEQFGLDTMVAAYDRLYDGLLAARAPKARTELQAG